MDLSVVVVNWNTRSLLDRCLRSLPAGADVIVVDNASSDGSAEMVRQRHPRARMIANPRNLGYAAGNNQGIRAARGRLVLLLNSDIAVPSGAVERLVSRLQAHPKWGAASCRLLNEDGSVQRMARRFPTYATLLALHTSLRYRAWARPLLDRLHLRRWDFSGERSVEQPAAACLLLRREVLDRVGDFDESLFLYYNDVDLCRRIADAGWKIGFVGSAEMTHAGSASTHRFDRVADEKTRNALQYVRKVYGPLPAWILGLGILADAARGAAPGEGTRVPRWGATLRALLNL